jgi:hypothetical protein
MTAKKLQKALEAKLVQMGKLRDDLDKIIDEAQTQRDTVERAMSCVEDARDALSELV